MSAGAMSAGTTGVSVLDRLSWSVRRELWENRSLYLAPLAVAAVFLVGFSISLVGLPERTRAALALGPAERQAAIEQPYLIAALVLMGVGLLVAVFYCLDALYGERRDRSILFWKSLPVSDAVTVLSKASVPILVLPVVTFMATVATHLIMLLTSAAVLAGSGTGAGTVWAHVPFLEVSAISFVHLVAFHGIGYAPFYGWLLMVSAWAKRLPLLWAVLPPVAIAAVERIAFGTSHFESAIRDRFQGGPTPAEPAGPMTMETMTPPLDEFLTDPGLWIGLLVTAAFLSAAVRLRRARGPV